jgi:hypothetical protein
MNLDRLDPQGHIRPEADLANVQPEYQGVDDAAAELLAGEFGLLVHSAYRHDSVVQGNAVPGRSDVDVVAALLAAPVDENRRRADHAERIPVERFLVLCVDEKPQIQAPDRTAPSLPILPTTPARRSQLCPPRHRQQLLLASAPEQLPRDAASSTYRGTSSNRSVGWWW